MKVTSVALVAVFVLLAAVAQEAAAKKRKCSEKPADLDDAAIEKAVEDCAEEALQNGGDPEKVLDECAAKLLKDYQDHHSNRDCGGQTKGFSGFMQKAKAIAKALKDAFTKGSDAVADAINQLHKGLENLIESGKQMYESFKKSLKNGGGDGGDEKDEYTNEGTESTEQANNE